MQKTAFEKSVDESFSVFHQLWRLAKAPRQNAFNYLFNKKNFPKAETWCIAGGLILWIYWAAWTITTLLVWAMGSDLVIESFLIKGDYLANGRIGEAMSIAAVAAVCIFLFGRITARLLGYCYLPLSLLLWGAQSSRTRHIYWLQLIAAVIICPIIAILSGRKHTKIIWGEGTSRLEICTWVDWINPDYNEVMLYFGYPMSLIIALGGLLIAVFYHKYKPQMDKNWSAEGLDSHLLDGDANN